MLSKFTLLFKIFSLIEYIDLGLPLILVFNPSFFKTFLIGRQNLLMYLFLLTFVSFNFKEIAL